MKKALISPNERSLTGDQRIAQVEDVNPDPESGGVPFPVAPPLFWIDVADEVTTQDGWDGKQPVKYVPPPPLPEQQSTVKQLADLLVTKNIITAQDAALINEVPAAVMAATASVVPTGS